MSTRRRSNVDLLTPFGIGGPVFDGSQPFIYQCFHFLTEDGDGKRIFALRGVSKRWRALVDEQMDNGHWAILYVCTVEDPYLRQFLLARSAHLYARAASAGAENDMRAAFMLHLKQTSEAPVGTERCVTGMPGMYLTLDLCKQLCINAACTPKRFALEFDMELRGLAYFAVWTATRGRARWGSLGEKEEAMSKLLAWWKATVREVSANVEGRLALRSEAERAEARASITNFVRVMAAVPFHACRQTEEFRDIGLQQLRAKGARQA